MSEGVRDWLLSLTGMTRRAAAFDTRPDVPSLLTGRASKGIAKLLRVAACCCLWPASNWSPNRRASSSTRPPIFSPTKKSELRPGVQTSPKEQAKVSLALLPTVTLVDSLHSRETIRSDG